MMINEMGKGVGVSWEAIGKDVRDDLGLPIWAKDANGMFVCGDQRQQLFAVDCWMVGLNIPMFDKWLSNLDDSSAQQSLLSRREKAMDATNADDHNAFMRHLEHMLTSWRDIERSRYLLSLASNSKDKKLRAMLERREKMKADFKKKLRKLSLEISEERRRIGVVTPAESKRRMIRAEQRLSRRSEQPQGKE